MFMFAQKHGKVPRKEYGRAGFNLFQKMLGLVKMEFSGRYNGMYGIADVALLLMYMCKGSTYAEQAALDRDHDGIKDPGADWLLPKIQNINYNVMLRRSAMMLRKTVHLLAKKGMIPAFQTIVIDKTKYPRYSKSRT